MPDLSWITTRLIELRLRVVESDRDQGDVPGWVLVTVMTAALVTILYAVAGDRLEALLEEALTGVLE
jgi:hypothetical protein